MKIVIRKPLRRVLSRLSFELLTQEGWSQPKSNLIRHVPRPTLMG